LEENSASLDDRPQTSDQKIDSVKKAEAGARAEAIRGQLREWLSLARQDEAMDDLLANRDMSETA